MKKKNLEAVMAIILLICVMVVSTKNTVPVFNQNVTIVKEDKKTVVIDAGHGGADPGKIGVNNELEKDINLQIANKLKMFLEAADINVIMTRETDAGLYSENASNKKAEDFKNRLSIINDENTDLTISIHQNSYHEEYVKGAQVFYYSNSIEGKELAEILQSILVEKTQPDNTRLAKPNDSYYLLKKTSVTTVIAECGFLSNYEETAKLTDELYQEKIAWALHLGILQFLNEQE